MCNPGCLPCKRLTELIEEREVGYLEGYGAAMEDGWGEPGHIKAAIAAAVQRVEALPEYALRDTCLAAIKGERP